MGCAPLTISAQLTISIGCHNGLHHGILRRLSPPHVIVNGVAAFIADVPPAERDERSTRPDCDAHLHERPPTTSHGYDGIGRPDQDRIAHYSHTGHDMDAQEFVSLISRAAAKDTHRRTACSFGSL